MTTEPTDLREDLLNIVSGLLHDRGNRVDSWPADEAAAWRRNGGFADGRRAVKKLRMEKAASDLLAVITPYMREAQAEAWDEGKAGGLRQADYEYGAGHFYAATNPYAEESTDDE